MAEIVADMVAYLTAVLEEVDTAILYVGAHQIAVNTVERETRYPGLIVCVTMNGEEVVVDPSSIVAIKAEADGLRSPEFVL